MPARPPTLARRVLGVAVDLARDRAPWLSEQAYRVLAVPLQWVDPMGGARSAEARLDHIRDRVAGMAARGRVRRGEQRRIQRDLTRTREDLERITVRLPVVQARGLTLRLAAYAEILGTLPGRSPARGRPARALNLAVLSVAAAAAWTGAFWLVAGPPAAVGAGLATGTVTALGATSLRNRQACKVRIGALADALTEVDETIRGPNDVDLRGLDRDRRALLERARGSGRLDERGVEALRWIDTHLDDLLIRLLEGDLEPRDSHLVQATVTRYLPDTLEPFLALPDPRTRVRARPAAEEVADQLASIEGGLADVARRPGRNRPETLLLLQGDFLRSKFGESSM